MKATLFILIISFLFGCKSSKEVSVTKDLAKLIVEIDDEKQIESLKNKIELYHSNPETVFKDEAYYYDTQNNKNQAYRGKSKEIKENIEWFLLIDNLKLNNYIIEFDISSAKEDVIYGTQLLINKRKLILPTFPNIPDNELKFVGSYLAYYNKILDEQGVVLINLDINSDSYVTALIRKQNLNKIIDLANKSDNKIQEYSIENIGKI